MSKSKTNGTYKIFRGDDDEPKTFDSLHEFKKICDLLDEQDEPYEVETPEQDDLDAEDHATADPKTNGGNSSGDGSQPVTIDTAVDQADDGAEQPEPPTPDAGAANAEVLDTETRIQEYDDPIPNLPAWMKEEVREHGGMDLNKDGCQVIASAMNFEVSASADVKSHEMDFEYACYTATVRRPDGRVFSAVGDCHIEESGKQKKDLNRMAETRAKKRAVKWATAGGIEPFVTGEMDG